VIEKYCSHFIIDVKKNTYRSLKSICVIKTLLSNVINLLITHLFSNCPAPLLSLTESSEQLGLGILRDAPSLLLCQRAGCSRSDVGVGVDLVLLLLSYIFM
jgi:hypothetical protein